MSKLRWTWVGTRSTGTSHLRSGKGCDDFGACVELSCISDPVLIAIASDGAGSARHSSIGSWIAVRAFIQNAVRFLESGHVLTDLSPEVLKGWLDNIRDRISMRAREQNATPRDFAATLVGSLVATNYALFVHVGDGAAVFKARDTAEWIVASWPAQGEYAATTFFVTDDPEPHCRFAVVDQQVDELAVFTDGIERLVLDFSEQSAFAPFFDKMFFPLQTSSAGRDRKLSRDLRRFLESSSVCEKTDDDKTLILARRTAGA
jgi:hypothetical protein